VCARKPRTRSVPANLWWLPLLCLLWPSACGKPEEPAAPSTPKRALLRGNPEADLAQRLKDILQAAASSEEGALEEQVRALLLKDPAGWFQSRFPPSLAAALEEAEAKSAPHVARRLEEIFRHLAREQRMKTIQVSRHTREQPAGPTGLEREALERMTLATPLFSATFKRSPRDLGFRLWSFVREGASWRFVGRMEALDR